MLRASNPLRLAAIALAAACLTTSCDADLWEFTDSDRGAYVSLQDAPIASTLAQLPQYTEWVKVLQYSQLYPTMNALYDAQTQALRYTMFAPNDQSLRQFYDQRGVQGIEDLGRDYAAAMVRTMTYSGDSLLLAERFTSTVTQLPLSMVAGEPITITVDAASPGYLLNDRVHISRHHTSCTNGLFYEAEGVIPPLVETLWDRLTASGNSTIMQQVMQRTGYDRLLHTVADTAVVLGSHVVHRHYYTLLNVTDATFAKAGISNIDDLTQAIAKRSATPGITADSLLRQYAQYHILDSRYKLSELTAMNGDDTLAVASRTLAPDQIYMVTRRYTASADGATDARPYITYFNNDDIAGQGPVAEASDVEAKNGYMHQLSGWMPVFEPRQTTVIWDLADYSQVREAVGDEHYRPASPEVTETKVDLSRLSCYKVDVPNGRGNNNYTELCYVTAKSNLKQCLYYDRVIFNMGYLGSVEMMSPTLVKGRYRMTVDLAYLTDQSIMRTSSGCKGGLLKILVDVPEDFDPATDDEANYQKAIVAPYTQITKSTPGVYEATLYDEIVFDTTSAHRFRFVIMDPAASSSSKVYLQFDAIKFEPITE